ncbi:MAG: hypothetical protein L0L69_04945 [Propionibacterium sp.]|nr:hypothetical protein [Propionibacterium sp.]
MMTKLLRHQFLSTGRLLGSVIGVIVLITVVSLAAALLRLPFIGAFGLGIAYLLLVILVPVALLLLAVDYWQSMYGQRGYFTMSLPVRGRELFATKTLHAMLIALGTGAVVLLGAVLTRVADARLRGAPVGESLGDAWDQVRALPAGALWLIVAAVLVWVATTIVQVAAVLSISAQGRFNHLGVGAPLIGLVLLYLGNQVTSLVAMLWVPLGVVLSGPDTGALVARGMWSSFAEAVRTGGDPEILGVGSLASSVVIAALLGWWAVHSIEHHTSLR